MVMDWVEFTGKTVNEAVTNALLNFQTTSENVDVEVLEKESSGILGLFSKPAKVRVRQKMSIENIARTFLDKVFHAMKLEADYEVVYDEENGLVDINLKGEEMGVIIGKRGQTLDSLQYLTSLVLNKESKSYLKVKLDTENYRERRKETLENLAKNIAHKVKKTRHAVTLEPMNPFERRIIHSALQNDRFVETHSEGEEPYRKVVITLKKNVKEYNNNYGSKKPAKNNTTKSSSYSRDYMKDYKQYKESKEKEKLLAQASNTEE